MRGRAYRRRKAFTKMMRRLKEDRNEHYDNLKCACWHDPRAIARFKEQPQICSCLGCGNQRKHYGLTIQERRWVDG